jgi:HlyD family secretion protein
MPLLPRPSPKAISPVSKEDRLSLPVILEFQSPSSAILAAPVPRSARSITWIICSMFLAGLLATGFIPVDRVVTMRGKVVSEVPTQVVQPLDASIVRSIEVHEGQKVRKGDLLAQLDPTFAAADVGALQAQVSSYSAQVDRLQAEAANKPYTYEGTNADRALQAAIFAQRKSEFEFKLEGYKQKIDGLVSVIARSESDASGYRDRLAVAQNLQNMRMELERLNVGSKLNTLAAVDNRAEMARFLANAMQTAESGKRDLAAMIAERDGYVQQWHADVSQQLSDAGSKLSDAQESLHKADLRRRLVELRADRDATVLTVAKVSPGSVMQPGQQFFTLMPADAPLAVEGILPGSEGGFVHLGDPVAIKFDTFEYAHYGMAYGTVRSLSADTFFGSDQQAAQNSAIPLPPGGTEAFYRGQITIDRVALRDVPADFHLTPGLTVTADIKVGKRTVLTYFLSRIVPVATESMREPGN